VARCAPLPRETNLTDRLTLFVLWPILSMPSTLRMFFVLASAESIRADLLAAMEGHVLAQAELTGVFTPPQP